MRAGCFTLVATEMVLVRLFPNTFQHRVWTFHSSKFWWCVRLLATVRVMVYRDADCVVMVRLKN